MRRKVPLRAIRVITAGLRPQLLRDLVEDTISHTEDMEIVTADVGFRELAETIEKTGAHVVVMGLEHGEVPEKYTDVLDPTPGFPVVGIVPNGHRFSVHLNDLGTEGLRWIIRASCL